VSSTAENDAFLVVYASAYDVSACSRVLFLIPIDASSTSFRTLVEGELLTSRFAGAAPVALDAVREDKDRGGEMRFVFSSSFFISFFFTSLSSHRNHRVDDSRNHAVVDIYTRFAG
jgi:hypothetical protein